MALEIDNMIDLTAYPDNPEPKLVSQLSIIHESSDGELVQYYIRPGNQTQGDKNTWAIGVYDKDSQSYSYTEYPDVVWNKPGQRISGNRVERLGVKAFPGMGAFAFYKLSHRKITRIVIPVNRKNKKNEAPTIEAMVNPDGTVTFTIIPPEKPAYECYRIVMDHDIYSEEYITYDLEFIAPVPLISGTYKCFAVGYGEEGQLFSKESNVIELELAGKSRVFESPFYSKADIDRLTTLKDLTFSGNQEASYNGKAAVSVVIPKQEGAVLYGTEEPDEMLGVNGSVYVQYEIDEETESPVITAEWIRLEDTWIRR